MFRHLKKHDLASGGFTLIELLIVVAIIAILAAIAVPNFLEAQVRAKISRARSDMRTAATALEAYAVDYNKHPMEIGRINSPTPVNSGIIVDNMPEPRNFRNGYGTVRGQSWQTVPESLTTPIAYITTVNSDPFKQSAPCKSAYPATEFDQGKPWTSKNIFDSGFIYQNITQRVVAFNAPNSTASAYNNADLAAYGAWRLMSVGPNKTYVLIGSDNATDKLAWLYDSTNGTNSSGMLVRTQRDPQNTNSSRAAGT